MPEDITSDDLTSASQLNAVDSEETVDLGEPSQEPVVSNSDLRGLSLDELNETLGKQFKDKETALKSLKDTFTYVGKKVEQVETELKSKGFISKNDLETVLFYRDNPEYSTYKDVIDSFAGKHGITPAEAIKSEALSGLFAKAKQADQYNNTQSVIQTNPRLAESRSSLDKAREAILRNGRSSDVESLVAKAVLDAYGE